ncbi:hypothetical protein EUX98_g7237 [Antrodiella citrinella]|uniref:Uncharacterized protein n=1 Tax=Antrodiella citrinella TaxID=2447956 RepID=A0A4V3XHW7_9APHY|nr:hypothetical protein EUX98_g7237 [Antrodiella citrinella]
MALPPSHDPLDQYIGLDDHDVPQFPAKTYYIPLPPYPLPLLDKLVFVVARLYAADNGNTAYVSFHPRYGCQPRDFNLDVWLPVPARDIFHIRRVRSDGEVFLLPLDGRSYGFPLKKSWKLCVGNLDMFCLDEIEGTKRSEVTHRLTAPPV